MNFQVQYLGYEKTFKSFEEACLFAAQLPVKRHFDIWQDFELWVSYTWNVLTGKGELDVPESVKVVN